MHDHAIIKEKLRNMRCTQFVQFGFLNAQITRAFAEFGKVDYYSQMKFNPFDGEKNVNIVEQEGPMAYTSKKYHKKKIDAVFSNRHV